MVSKVWFTTQMLLARIVGSNLEFNFTVAVVCFALLYFIDANSVVQ